MPNDDVFKIATSKMVGDILIARAAPFEIGHPYNLLQCVNDAQLQQLDLTRPDDAFTVQMVTRVHLRQENGSLTPQPVNVPFLITDPDRPWVLTATGRSDYPFEIVFDRDTAQLTASSTDASIAAFELEGYRGPLWDGATTPSSPPNLCTAMHTQLLGVASAEEIAEAIAEATPIESRVDNVWQVLSTYGGVRTLAPDAAEMGALLQRAQDHAYTLSVGSEDEAGYVVITLDEFQARQNDPHRQLDRQYFLPLNTVDQFWLGGHPFTILPRVEGTEPDLTLVLETGGDEPPTRVHELHLSVQSIDEPAVSFAELVKDPDTRELHLTLFALGRMYNVLLGAIQSTDVRLGSIYYGPASVLISRCDWELAVAAYNRGGKVNIGRRR
jgi:hypothetical protein